MKLILVVLSVLFSAVTPASALYDYIKPGNEVLSRKKLINPKLSFAKNVDINKYMGKWYAITALPQSFTSHCLSQSAKYLLKPNNSVAVYNSCNGKVSITGEAVSVDPVNNAILEVKFDQFFFELFGLKGDYVIFKLDPNYKLALVGSRNLKSLWLLSRSQSIPAYQYNEYINYAQKLGFDTDKLVPSQF